MDNCDYCSDAVSCDTCSADYEYDYILGMCMYVDTTVVCMDNCEICIAAGECEKCNEGYVYDTTNYYCYEPYCIPESKWDDYTQQCECITPETSI